MHPARHRAQSEHLGQRRPSITIVRPLRFVSALAGASSSIGKMIGTQWVKVTPPFLINSNSRSGHSAPIDLPWPRRVAQRQSPGMNVEHGGERHIDAFAAKAPRSSARQFQRREFANRVQATSADQLNRRPLVAPSFRWCKNVVACVFSRNREKMDLSAKPPPACLDMDRRRPSSRRTKRWLSDMTTMVLTFGRRGRTAGAQGSLSTRRVVAPACSTV